MKTSAAISAAKQKRYTERELGKGVEEAVRQLEAGKKEGAAAKLGFEHMAGGPRTASAIINMPKAYILELAKTGKFPTAARHAGISTTVAAPVPGTAADVSIGTPLKRKHRYDLAFQTVEEKNTFIQEVARLCVASPIKGFVAHYNTVQAAMLSVALQKPAKTTKYIAQDIINAVAAKCEGILAKAEAEPELRIQIVEKVVIPPIDATTLHRADLMAVVGLIDENDRNDLMYQLAMIQRRASEPEPVKPVRMTYMVQPKEDTTKMRRIKFVVIDKHVKTIRRDIEANEPLMHLMETKNVVIEYHEIDERPRNLGIKDYVILGHNINSAWYNKMLTVYGRDNVIKLEFAQQIMQWMLDTLSRVNNAALQNA